MIERSPITIADIEKTVDEIKNRLEPEQFVFTLTFPDGRKIIRCSDEKAYMMMIEAWGKNDG